jgi:hypothetical protein
MFLTFFYAWTHQSQLPAVSAAYGHTTSHKLSEGEPVTTQFYLNQKRAFESRGRALNYQYCLDAKLTRSTGNGVENIIGRLSKQPHNFEHCLAVSDAAGVHAGLSESRG